MNTDSNVDSVEESKCDKCTDSQESKGREEKKNMKADIDFLLAFIVSDFVEKIKKIMLIVKD